MRGADPMPAPKASSVGTEFPQRCRSDWHVGKWAGSARCDVGRQADHLRQHTPDFDRFHSSLGLPPKSVSYSLATVDLRSAGTTRRWQLTIAIVAALSLFVALIAGSSLRPQLAAAALPEPAAWTHGTLGGQAHASQVQVHAAVQPISDLAHAFSPDCTPTNKKPFHSMWMTHDRPTSWTHLSPQSGWLPLPASFAASEFPPGGTHWAEPGAPPVNRDVLIQLCVTRC